MPWSVARATISAAGRGPWARRSRKTLRARVVLGPRVLRRGLRRFWVWVGTPQAPVAEFWMEKERAGGSGPWVFLTLTRARWNGAPEGVRGAIRGSMRPVTRTEAAGECCAAARLMAWARGSERDLSTALTLRSRNRHLVRAPTYVVECGERAERIGESTRWGAHHEVRPRHHWCPRYRSG
jgi:hypothetical protein